MNARHAAPGKHQKPIETALGGAVAVSRSGDGVRVHDLERVGRTPADGPEHSVTDTTSGEIYEPWTNGHAVGYKITRPDGRVEYLYLNASTGGDKWDHKPNVFLYYGPNGDPSGDGALHYYDLDD